MNNRSVDNYERNISEWCEAMIMIMAVNKPVSTSSFVFELRIVFPPFGKSPYGSRPNSVML